MNYLLRLIILFLFTSSLLAKVDPFIQPYVSELRKETPDDSLERLSKLKKDELIKLHHGYGTWIRNKWLWGNRNQKLITYFQGKGLKHPDDMSMELIRALWEDLQDNPPKPSNVKQCPLKTWKLSKLEFSPHDPYLVTVLGFSYGPDAKKYILKMSGVVSKFFYEGSESNPKFTFVSSYFSEKVDAVKAYEHLKSRVSSQELQNVKMKEREVIWMAGRDISKSCFEQIVKGI